MNDGLRFYFPGGRVAETLAEALRFDESFIVATDDHAYVYLVDWAELDGVDRAELLSLLDYPEDEQARVLRREIDDLDEDERDMARRDDVQTLLAWTTERQIPS